MKRQNYSRFCDCAENLFLTAVTTDDFWEHTSILVLFQLVHFYWKHFCGSCTPSWRLCSVLRVEHLVLWHRGEDGLCCPRDSVLQPLPTFPSPQVLSRFSHVQLSATLGPVAHQASRSVRFSRKNTGVGCTALSQGIFPIQGSNLRLLCLLHCRQILYPLNHQGKPNFEYLSPDLVRSTFGYHYFY